MMPPYQVLKSMETAQETAQANALLFETLLFFTLYSTFQDGRYGRSPLMTRCCIEIPKGLQMTRCCIQKPMRQ
jgi:hypothetical protein